MKVGDLIEFSPHRNDKIMEVGTVIELTKKASKKTIVIYMPTYKHHFSRFKYISQVPRFDPEHMPDGLLLLLAFLIYPALLT